MAVFFNVKSTKRVPASVLSGIRVHLRYNVLFILRVFGIYLAHLRVLFQGVLVQKGLM